MRQVLQITLSLTVITIAVLLSACAPIRHTAFGEHTGIAVSNLNESSISNLPSLPMEEGAPLQFALITDSHGNYQDLAKTVKRLNQKALHFVMHLGDLTDLGLAIEYEAFFAMMRELRHTWMAVIGNHDTVGNGKNIFKKVFGYSNTYFDYGNYRFVLFNNNALDFYPEKIDFVWLEEVVTSSPSPVIIFQHVNPFNEQYFTSAEQEHFLRILDTEKVPAVFHGHLHTFSQKKYGKTLIQQIGRVQGQQHAVISLQEDSLKVSSCKEDRCEEYIHHFNNLL